MRKDDVLRLPTPTLIEMCNRFASGKVRAEVNSLLDVASSWPLWELTCSREPSWALKMDHGRCVIFSRSDNGDEIIVPSGKPAEAIKRAFLISVLR